jgi:hypothetical protein
MSHERCRKGRKSVNISARHGAIQIIYEISQTARARRMTLSATRITRTLRMIPHVHYTSGQCRVFHCGSFVGCLRIPCCTVARIPSQDITDQHRTSLTSLTAKGYSGKILFRALMCVVVWMKWFVLRERSEVCCEQFEVGYKTEYEMVELWLIQCIVLK